MPPPSYLPPPLVHCLALQFADARNLSAVSDASKQSTLLAVAALFAAKDGKGTVRLIDNIVLGEEVKDR